MATYLIQIPANYRARVGGNSSVSVDASSPQEAKTQVVQVGIPAALIGNPTEITGNITSGSLPPNVSEYILPTSGPDRSSVLRSDRIIGANNYTNQPVGELQFYPDGSPKSTGQNTSLRRDASGRIIRGGTEESSGNPFAANINRPPTMAEVQAALPYQLGTPESPFYQPPSYQRMTSEDFARIRANANQPLFDEGSFLGGAFNTGGSLPAGSFATDTEPLEDIDALEAENFARQERERLAKIRREAAAADAATTADAADAADAADDNGDDDKLDASADMPANLPPYWQERYNDYLGLPGEQQQAILDNQLQNYIELNAWQGTQEEDGGVSGAAGANLTLEELEALAKGRTTSNGAGEGFTFQPGAFTGIPQPMNFDGFPVTSLQDMLNIFYSDPIQFIVEQPVIGTIGYDEETGLPVEGIVGSQQSLSPAAQAALQAFSTQRGAESADLASRFGTSTPFGVIAGMGGRTAAADAINLAKLQARAGVSNPYAALGIGETIDDIGTILRGGLSAQEQADLAGLQARGGLSAQERLAEQRLGILPSLFQATPQALGGLSRVLGGEEALRGALSPFFGGVPARQDDAQQDITQNISGFPFGGQPVNMNIAGSPFGGQPVSMNIAGPPVTQQEVPRFRPTLGDYQGAGMFEQGGFQAEAGIAGQELPKFLGEVSPLGTSTARGGLGATTTGRFTF